LFAQYIFIPINITCKGIDIIIYGSHELLSNLITFLL
jgi:hypothetical protein